MARAGDSMLREHGRQGGEREARQGESRFGRQGEACFGAARPVVARQAGPVEAWYGMAMRGPERRGTARPRPLFGGAFYFPTAQAMSAITRNAYQACFAAN